MPEKKLYLKVKSFSFTTPEKPITPNPQDEQPPQYTELNTDSVKQTKKKFWFWKK